MAIPANGRTYEYHYDAIAWAERCASLYFASFQQQGGCAVHAQITSVDGCPAVLWDSTSCGQPILNYIVCLEGTGGEHGGLRQSLKNPGWCSSRTRLVTSSQLLPDSVSLSIARWKTRVVEFKQFLLNAVYQCVFSSPIYRENADGNSGITQVIAAYFVDAPKESFVVTDTIYVMTASVFGVPRSIPLSTTIVGGIGNTSISASTGTLERIAAAVEEVSMSRIEVSANNGDSMFNIVGGTRAASEE